MIPFSLTTMLGTARLGLVSLALVVLAAAASACGGTRSTLPEAKTAHPTFDSPADKCLAVADAKRERRPDEPAKVTVKHILVKYAGAKKADESITRTREDACLRAQEARSKLEQGASFTEIVNEYSEEPGAKSREGSVGPIQRSDVVPQFADAAFELKPGEVSHVVETNFGFHVIMRTE